VTLTLTRFYIRTELKGNTLLFRSKYVLVKLTALLVTLDAQRGDCNLDPHNWVSVPNNWGLDPHNWSRTLIIGLLTLIIGLWSLIIGFGPSYFIIWHGTVTIGL
jgi:hypothetical protein